MKEKYYNIYPSLPDTLKSKLTAENIVHNYNFITRGYLNIKKKDRNKAIELECYCESELIDYMQSVIEDIKENRNFDIFNNLHKDFLFINEIGEMCDIDNGKFINLQFLRVLSYLCHLINQINDDFFREVLLTPDYLNGYMCALRNCF